MKFTPETETVAAVLPTKLSRAVKRRARDEGRTVSNYIRHVLAHALVNDRDELDGLTESSSNSVEQAAR